MATTGSNIPNIHPDASFETKKKDTSPPYTVSMSFDEMMSHMRAAMKDGRRRTRQREYQRELYRLQHGLASSEKED